MKPLKKETLGTAPNFTLADIDGQSVKLSYYQNRKYIVLVFNRGFAWPFCRRHIAQLRHNYQQFVNRDAEILVVGPENQKAFAQYWNKEQLPFVGLPDPTHKVANLYGQEVKLLKFGRMPAIIVVDKQGQIRTRHYSNSMRDIPDNAKLLNLLDTLNLELAGIEKTQ